MHSQALIAHAKVLATAIVAGVVGAGTTLVGQGVPDPHTQGTVAFVFAAFTWAMGLFHRWETSPADAKQEVQGDLVSVLREVLPMAEQFLANLAERDAQRAASASSGTPRDQEVTPPLGTSRRSL